MTQTQDFYDLITLLDFIRTNNFPEFVRTAKCLSHSLRSNSEPNKYISDLLVDKSLNRQQVAELCDSLVTAVDHVQTFNESFRSYTDLNGIFNPNGEEKDIDAEEDEDDLSFISDTDADAANITAYTSLDDDEAEEEEEDDGDDEDYDEYGASGSESVGPEEDTRELPQDLDDTVVTKPPRKLIKTVHETE